MSWLHRQKPDGESHRDSVPADAGSGPAEAEVVGVGILYAELPDGRIVPMMIVVETASPESAGESGDSETETPSPDGSEWA